jgi:2-polyprenyl-6-methoxyphenol hydroxylase-like FAD-dependent oxidoreductase
LLRSHADGAEERVHTRFLVGCDGAHSAIRKAAGIPFEGDAYLQSFVLGDMEVDGPLQPDTLHAFPDAGGVAMFFPLGAPSTWRVIASSIADGKGGSHGRGRQPDESITKRDLSLAQLQEIVDVSTGGSLRLTEPAWLARFRLHHRQAKHYRNGPVFLAGDAAHVHSPVGAQGMNTGIQDAWNLGWKVALVTAGAANASLLDSYEAERWPVGRVLLRYTDRAFSLFLRSMSASRFATLMRRRVVPHIVPSMLRSTRVRESAVHFISELGVRYRGSFAVEEGVPRLRQGPMAGDRLPDLKVMRDGEPVFLHHALARPHLHLLLCGPVEAWEPER